MDASEKEIINRKIRIDFGWKFGSRDECAPKYRDNFTDVWWSPDGAPYCEADAPNFFTDPACTLMLMEKGRIEVSPLIDGRYQARVFGGNEVFGSDTIGEAVAMAYVKMKGIHE